MRHYEIALLIHPGHSLEIPNMLERYKEVIEASSGKIHRQEDWGRLQLAYSIDNLHKAHYILLNIEINTATLTELLSMFKFNDLILRYLLIKEKKAISDESPMLTALKKEDQKN